MGRVPDTDPVIHLDTHVVVWLYSGEHDRIPSGLRTRLETERLAVSPIVRLELGYLQEVGRLRRSPAEILDELARALGLRVDDTPFADVVAIAQTERLHFTRDPFDRIIAGQAIAADAELATKDEQLRTNLSMAVWD